MRMNDLEFSLVGYAITVTELPLIGYEILLKLSPLKGGGS
jgi:hypothetical protein